MSHIASNVVHLPLIHYQQRTNLSPQQMDQKSCRGKLTPVLYYSVLQIYRAFHILSYLILKTILWSQEALSHYSVCLKGLAGKHRALWSDHWPTRAVWGVSLLTGRWLADCAASRGHCGSSERGRGCTQNNPGWLHPNLWVRNPCFHWRQLCARGGR